MTMEILAESAVRAIVLALAVALVLRALRIHSARLAHRAWTAVAVVMLLLPAFVAWGPELALPLLPSQTGRVIHALTTGDDAAAEPGRLPMTAAFATDGPQRQVMWAFAAMTAMTTYFAVAGLFLLRLVVGLLRARAMRRAAVQVHGRLTHPACVTPMTIGIVAPVVVLPPDWATWDDAELSAVLAHEQEHARRRDPLATAIAFLNRAIFWFHPQAWWLQREIARLSEQACDAAVIARGHDSDVYSACLLRFARRATDAGGRIAPIAMTMSGAGLQDRLAMIGRPLPPRLSGSRVACAAVTCAVLVVVCAAAAPTAAPGQGLRAPALGQASWSVETSEHFEIFHDGLPQDRVGGVVSEAEAAYAQLSAALKHDMPEPVAIVLVRRDRDLPVAASPARAVVRPNGVPVGGRLLISLESLDRRTGILVHELTHQFAFEIVPGVSRAAPVLIEGLAEHQRDVWTAQDVRMVRNAVAIGAVPSVASLDAPDRQWAHAVFDFVAAQHGEEGVRRLLFALRAHDTLVQAVPMAFGVPFGEFDQEFGGYVTARFGQP